MRRTAASHHLASSFTDLMTSLMVIFILLFVANLNNVAGARKVVQQSLLAELRAQLEKKHFTETEIQEDPKDPYAIVLIFPDSLLFDRGSSEVRESGARYLSELVPILSAVVCNQAQKDKIESLVVEGHTDSTYRAMPASDIGRDYNLRLSQGRSMEVVRVSLSSLKVKQHRDCIRGMMSASGRGQEELLPNVAGDSEKQRRVVFKIRVKGSLAEELTRQREGAGAG